MNTSMKKKQYRQNNNFFTKLYGSNIMKWYPKMSYPDIRHPNTTEEPNSGRLDENTDQSSNPPPPDNLLVRHNLHHLGTYTIDPMGSKDADDAFSILPISPTRTNLYVHICDPTAWIPSMESESFKCAASNGTSFYPSGQRTRRMFTKSIRQLSSMRRGVRKAFSFCFEFSHTYNNPVLDPFHQRLQSSDLLLKDIVLQMSSVRCSRENEHSYESAALNFSKGSPLLALLQKMTQLLRKTLETPSNGITPLPVMFGKMEYLELSVPKLSHHNGRVVMCRDSPNKVEVKRMIAILATAVNGTIANILQILSKDLDAYIDRSISLYTHFSSPLRRFSDCMLHFEMKRLLRQSGHMDGVRMSELLGFPDTEKIGGSAFDMDNMTKMLQTSKKAVIHQQVLHQRSMQFRCMQYIFQRLNLDGARRVRVKFKVGTADKGYLKLYFFMIDGHKVRVHHVVRQNKAYISDSVHDMSLTICNKPYNQFNDGVLPQIEALFYANE